MKRFRNRLAGAVVLFGAAACVAHFEGAELDDLLRDSSGRLEQPGGTSTPFDETVALDERAPAEPRLGSLGAGVRTTAELRVGAGADATDAPGKSSSAESGEAATGGAVASLDADGAAPSAGRTDDGAGPPETEEDATTSALVDRASVSEAWEAGIQHVAAGTADEEPAGARGAADSESDARAVEAVTERGTDPTAAEIVVRGRHLSLVRASLGGAGGVRDLLVEPSSGRILAAQVSLAPDGGAAPEGEEPPRRYELSFGELAWVEVEPGVVRPRLTGQAAYATGMPPDRTSVFDGRELARLRGVVTTVEPIEGALGEAILKLRDEKNLLHRVWIEGAPLVRRRVGGLEPGAALEVEGAWTRDGGGKLLVARQLVAGGATLVMRDESGRMQWRALAADLLSLRDLLAQGVPGPEGKAHVVLDLVVDAPERTVLTLGVASAAGEVRVAPAVLERTEQGWRLPAPPAAADSE